ncbi:MAG: methyltransferase domain-containing protein [Thermoplasmatota archaeon]
MPVEEGKVILDLVPSGGEKGPARKGDVFYNPAMEQNRDLSVLFLEVLVKNDILPGSNIRILDSQTGSGTRAVRFAKEVNDCPPVTGCDINPASLSTARKNAALNHVDVELIRADMRAHLLERRYSYIDIDPFGSPLPFMGSALGGIMNRGIIAVTATDTAALTGSVPRVSRRRYDVELCMTHCYQELSCRVLLGSIARRAASMDLSLAPLLFYSHDHFIRGYFLVQRGAKKADAMLENIKWFRYQSPLPPHSFDSLSELSRGGGRVIGPIWKGDLEDVTLVRSMLEELDSGDWEHLSSRSPIRMLLERAIEESSTPPLGYDVNTTSGSLKCSPPRMRDIEDELRGSDFSFSRSRFSSTIFKTDAPWETVASIFVNGGDE